MRVNVTISVQTVNFTSLLLSTIDRRLCNRSMSARMMDPCFAQNDRLRSFIIRAHIHIILHTDYEKAREVPTDLLTGTWKGVLISRQKSCSSMYSHTCRTKHTNTITIHDSDQYTDNTENLSCFKICGSPRN